MTDLADTPGYQNMITALALQALWQSLTKPQRRAMLADNCRAEHPKVLDNLLGMGLIDADDRLTELGETVVKWGRK